MENSYELETGNKLLLLQAISSIEHGLQCLEWMSKSPNENFIDAVDILRNRFAFFKECAFEDCSYDSFTIDKAKKLIKNVQGAELNGIQSQLSELRKQILAENNKDKN